MTAHDPQLLLQLMDTVLASAKYRDIAPELIRLVGSQELAKRHNLKAAIKATKNKLHQITGAYWQGKPTYGAWLEQLRAAHKPKGTTPDTEHLRTVCRGLMAAHASTRERLPILHDFYSTLFAGLPPIHAILDLACGLNPLTIPWMALPPNVAYHACDVNGEQMVFLQQVLPLLGVAGDAFLCDLLCATPRQAVDVAFLFKTIPCLEQVDRAIGPRLLQEINANVLFVSFPAQSLGGRNKGMVDTYHAHFVELLNDIEQKNWEIEHFSFATEVVFRLRRPL
ncbi:MAG: hypothetical protein KDE31_04465 [Caldilineaceae bacterium]|nr:hypothetical protein [Caldilineaceae bacterium]